MGVPVKLNNEIINREKVEYLAAYKQYLVAINKDRTSRKTETNPLRPEDATAREKAESVMNEPMYVGKTKDLRTRFRAHHDNGFLWEMKERFKRPPSEFVLFAFFCEPDLVRLAESILIQVINPAFCDQKT